MVLDASQMPEHPGYGPAGWHGRRLPGFFGQPLDDLQHPVALVLQEAQEHARLIVLVRIARLLVTPSGEWSRNPPLRPPSESARRV